MRACAPAWVKRLAWVYPPTFSLAQIANLAAERAWTRTGVRIFMWSCGTVAVARVGSPADAQLMHECLAQLLGTWGTGTTLRQLLAELRWARAQA